MCRRLKWKEPGRQNCRRVLAVPFLALGKVNFKAVETREVPCRACKGHSYFLVNSPDIPVHLEALPITCANRAKRVIERVTITRESLPAVLAAQRKRDWPGRKIKQVAVNSGVT